MKTYMEEKYVAFLLHDRSFYCLLKVADGNREWLGDEQHDSIKSFPEFFLCSWRCVEALGCCLTDSLKLALPALDQHKTKLAKVPEQAREELTWLNPNSAVIGSWELVCVGEWGS